MFPSEVARIANKINVRWSWCTEENAVFRGNTICSLFSFLVFFRWYQKLSKSVFPVVVQNKYKALTPGSESPLRGKALSVSGSPSCKLSLTEARGLLLPLTTRENSLTNHKAGKVWKRQESTLSPTGSNISDFGLYNVSSPFEFTVPTAARLVWVQRCRGDLVWVCTLASELLSSAWDLGYTCANGNEVQWITQGSVCMGQRSANRKDLYDFREFLSVGKCGQRSKLLPRAGPTGSMRESFLVLFWEIFLSVMTAIYLTAFVPCAS